MKLLILTLTLLGTISSSHACSDLSGFYKTPVGGTIHLTQSACEYVTMELPSQDNKSVELTFRPSESTDLMSLKQSYNILKPNGLILNLALGNNLNSVLIFSKESNDSLNLKSYTIESGKTTAYQESVLSRI